MNQTLRDRERRPGAGPSSLGLKSPAAGVRRSVFHAPSFALSSLRSIRSMRSPTMKFRGKEEPFRVESGAEDPWGVSEANIEMAKRPGENSPTFAFSSFRSIRSVRSPVIRFRNKNEPFRGESGDRSPWGVSEANTEMAKRTAEKTNEEEGEERQSKRGKIIKSASDDMERKGNQGMDKSKSRLMKLFQARTWSKARIRRNHTEEQGNNNDEGDGSSVESVTGDLEVVAFSDSVERDDALTEGDSPVATAEDDFISYVVREKKKERGERLVAHDKLNSRFRRPARIRNQGEQQEERVADGRT